VSSLHRPGIPAVGRDLRPLDSATAGIPTHPNAGESYTMFTGTPHAHLMIYQDPKMLKP
jgi:hypothetical protein